MGYVLEGPDGAGKSFLAATLQSTLNLRVEHFGPPERPPLEEYLHWLVDLDGTHHSHHRVIDRFHLGESVYGPIFRGTKPLTIPELSTIEWALMVRGYTLIHVTRSLKDLIDVIQERGDDMVNVDQVNQVVESYWRVMGMSFMHRWTYDWQAIRARPQLVPFSRDTSATLNFKTYWDELKSVPGTGSLTAQYVLVGDQCNPNLQEQSRDVPFACGQAADWLIRAIWYNRWQSHVYLTNAKKPNGDEDMVRAELWLIYQFRKQIPMVVIALGQNAHEVLAKHRIRHHTVHHPAYHRRFAYHDGPAAYAQLLRGCLPTPEPFPSGLVRDHLP